MIENCFNLSPGLHKGRPSYRRSFHPSKKRHAALQNMIYPNFFQFLWVSFALLDPDSHSQSMRIRIRNIGEVSFRHGKPRLVEYLYSNSGSGLGRGGGGEVYDVPNGSILQWIMVPCQHPSSPLPLFPHSGNGYSVQGAMVLPFLYIGIDCYGEI